MNVQEAKAKLEQIEAKLSAYSYAMSIIQWDGSTFAPPMSVKGRSRAQSILGGERLQIIISPEMNEVLTTLEEHKDELDHDTARKAKLLRRDYKEASCLPAQEFMAYMKLRSESEVAWQKAKEENDFASFAPYIKKIIAFQKKMAKILYPDLPTYDALLDLNEEGARAEQLDKFFDTIREPLVRLNKMVAGSPVNKTIEAIEQKLSGNTYSAAKLRELAELIMHSMHLNKDCCRMSESPHPFTMGLNKGDTRFTVFFYEDDMLPCIYSTLHEGGHATYQLQMGEDIQFSTLYGGASSAMHEAQARFYENNVGRSPSYTGHLYGYAKEVYGDMVDITADEFYLYANRSKPSLIRTEADELTYCLHIMIRYEIERMLFSEEITVDELPAVWNKKYKEYIGLDVPTDSEGVLQDIHWAWGMFGYFPSYALGSAYAAQIEHSIKRNIDFNECMLQNDMGPINKWLKENIHIHGARFTADEVMQKATGESFNPKYYIEYLDKKYKAIYG